MKIKEINKTTNEGKKGITKEKGDYGIERWKKLKAKRRNDNKGNEYAQKRRKQ